MELQLVSRHQGVPEREGDKKERESGWRGGGSWRGKDALKNTGLFCELSKGIKGLMNCLLEAISLSDIGSGARQRVAVTRVLM